MVHVSTSINAAFHTTGAHYLNANTTADARLHGWYVGVPCQEGKGERSRTGLSWTALLVSVSLRGPVWLARRDRREALSCL
jgi:hypothetical protein